MVTGRRMHPVPPAAQQSLSAKGERVASSGDPAGDDAGGKRVTADRD